MNWAFGLRGLALVGLVLAFTGPAQAAGNKPRSHLRHLLQTHGYQLALVGKWQLQTDPTDFDYWNVLPGEGVYIKPKLRPIGAEAKDLKECKGGYSEGVITSLSIDWLKKR